MRSTITAVLERNLKVTGDFCTEPYELPWAAEARFFVQVLEAAPDASLEFSTQISPDGLHWCDLDDTTHTVTAVGLSSWQVAGFGQWLRLSCRASGGSPVAKLRVYLVGKS
jgi:hypothetical protein